MSNRLLVVSYSSKVQQQAPPAAVGRCAVSRAGLTARVVLLAASAPRGSASSSAWPNQSLSRLSVSRVVLSGTCV